jgi:hypothetical protein
MAIFYPPPNPFIGGHQPLDTIKLVPPSVPVNNPPFGYQENLNSEIFETLKAAWQPPPFYYYWPLPKQIISGAAAVSQPWTNPWLAGIIASWQPAPPQPQQTPQRQIVSVPVNNPPSYDPQWFLEQINLAWQPASQYPPAPAQLPQGAPVNNPPGVNPAWLYENLNSQWQSGPPLPWTPPPRQITSIDQPPSYRQDALFGQINAAWQQTWAPPPLVLQPQGTIAVVNNPPPYSILWIQVLANLEWQPGPSLPQTLVLSTPPSGPVPPPPITRPISGGVYPGDEWRGRREKKRDAALQDARTGEEITPTLFAKRYIEAKRKAELADDQKIYEALLRFMIENDEDED